ADHRERGVFEPLEYRLALLDELFDPGPVGDIGGEEGEPEIDAEGEVLAVAADDEPLEALADDGDRLTNHRQSPGVEGIRLGMELEAGDAVAKVPQAGGAVAGDRLAEATEIGEAKPGREPRLVDIVAGGGQALQPSIRDAIERSTARLFEQQR